MYMLHAVKDKLLTIIISLASISTTSDGCTIPDPIVDVYIMDDGERKHALVLQIKF